MAASVVKFTANVSFLSLRGFTKIGTITSRLFVTRKASLLYGSMERKALSTQINLQSFQMTNLLRRNYLNTMARTMLPHHPSATDLQYNPGIIRKQNQFPTWCTTRSINTMSKLGKRKTCKAVAKRFRRTGSGQLKRWRSCTNHNLRKKRSRTRRALKKPILVNKTQLKLLNKMLNGW